MVVRLSALRTRPTLLPRNIIIFLFLVLISIINNKNNDALFLLSFLQQFHLLGYVLSNYGTINS
jgi:hypothetical protein